MPTDTPRKERPQSKNKTPSRKRSQLACLSCRARKVRCDVVHRGTPCVNCYLDSKTCVVNEKKMLRAIRSGNSIEAHQSLKLPSELPVESSNMTLDRKNSEQQDSRAPWISIMRMGLGFGAGRMARTEDFPVDLQELLMTINPSKPFRSQSKGDRSTYSRTSSMKGHDYNPASPSCSTHATSGDSDTLPELSDDSHSPPVSNGGNTPKDLYFTTNPSVADEFVAGDARDGPISFPNHDHCWTKSGHSPKSPGRQYESLVPNQEVNTKNDSRHLWHNPSWGLLGMQLELALESNNSPKNAGRGVSAVAEKSHTPSIPLRTSTAIDGEISLFDVLMSECALFGA